VVSLRRSSTAPRRSLIIACSSSTSGSPAINDDTVVRNFRATPYSVVAPGAGIGAGSVTPAIARCRRSLRSLSIPSATRLPTANGARIGSASELPARNAVIRPQSRRSIIRMSR
jgi:hypothetical protein